MERLQNINEEQAMTEGVPKGNFFKDGSEIFFELREDGYYMAGFEHIWNSTVTDIDKYSWEANPWVWVIEFERLERKANDKCSANNKE